MRRAPAKGLETLKPPHKRYQPDGKGKFPSRQVAATEDEKRVRGLRLRQAVNPQPRVGRLLRRLTSVSGRIRATLASARYMHRLRRNLVGELTRLRDEGGETARCFTLMPGDLCVPAAQLMTADPKRMLEQVRGALRRAEAHLMRSAAAFAADGWLILVVEAEHDREDEHFDFHFHGIADGGMLAVVKALRGQRRFKPQAKGDGETTPVQVKRAPPDSVPDALSYLLKSWYISRDRRFGTRPRCHRIPEPHHTTWLMWMDQWRLDDVVLLVGLRVVNRRLCPTRC